MCKTGQELNLSLRLFIWRFFRAKVDDINMRLACVMMPSAFDSIHWVMHVEFYMDTLLAHLNLHQWLVSGVVLL